MPSPTTVYNQGDIPEPEQPPIDIFCTEASEYVYFGDRMSKTKKSRKTVPSRVAVSQKKRDAEAAEEAAALLDPTKSFIPLFGTLNPMLTPRCISCGHVAPSFKSLVSHMEGQGPGKNANSDQVKAACPNVLFNFAYCYNLEVFNNLISAKQKETCHRFPDLDEDNDIDEEILDEVAYCNFMARMQIMICNKADPFKMQYNAKPPPDVPSHVIKDYVFNSTASSHTWNISCPPPHLHYLEDLRDSFFNGGEEGKAYVVEHMTERINYELRVQRHADANELPITADKTLFNPVPLEFLKKFEPKKRRSKRKGTSGSDDDEE